MCVHEIQFLCGHSTVIYTSITILHWWFCATVKYSYGITRGGGMVSETHQCYAPIHSMRLCVLRCGSHMRSARRNTTVCRPVYLCSRKFFNEKELTHEMQLILLRLRAFVYSWSEFAHKGCLPGRDTCLFRIWSVAGVFCFHIPFLQVMCRRSVYMDLWWYAALPQFR